MKTHLILRSTLFLAFMMMASLTFAQNSNMKDKSPEMKTYLIERALPDAGKLTAADLKAISQTSCNVLDGMGPQIKWLHSYVVDNYIYCVYQAANEDLLREHGTKGGFPVTRIMEVGSTISPATAERK
jgi:hypothetical protein